MRIIAFTRYGAQAASTRQRFLQYFPSLRSAGFQIEHHALLGDDYMESLVAGRPYPKSKVAAAYARRLRQVVAGGKGDIYWVYSELLPYIPAAIEEPLLKGRPVVYELDDAFFHSYDQSANPVVRRMLAGKHGRLLDKAAACICGNAYIQEFARRHCKRTVVVPTVVDAKQYQPALERRSKRLTIGWIGSPSTWEGVRPVLPVIQDIVAKFDARFLVIGAGHAAQHDVFQRMDLRAWAEDSEIADVQDMDLGIMPVLDRPFERGKSGYKLIQYMACGLPVIASPVGVNSEIVDDGVNGFLAKTPGEWRTALAKLLSDAHLRARLGTVGRERAVSGYSLASQEPVILQLFQSIA